MHRKQPLPKNSQNRPNTFRRQNNYLRSAQQEYMEYKRIYPRTGFLKVQTLTAQKTFPVENVKVEILKEFPSGEYVINTQMTDISGLINQVELPTLAKSQSLIPGIKDPFATYDIRLTHPDFTKVIIYNVPVYEDLTTFQLVEMTPKAITPNGAQVIEYDINAPVV